jgi:adenine-specific DNA-methyltransferase
LRLIILKCRGYGQNLDQRYPLMILMILMILKLNGFTNIYALFLLKSIYQLNTNGRLAYIIPSEFLNSDYGKLVKSALIKNKILRHIIVFDFEENVFDDALTTACILFCSNDKNYQKVKFSTIKKIDELENIQAYIANYGGVLNLWKRV